MTTSGTAQSSTIPADSLSNLLKDFGRYEPEQIEDQLEYIASWSAKVDDNHTRTQSNIYLSTILYRSNNLVEYEAVIVVLDSLRLADTTLTVLQRSTILNNYAQLLKTKGNFSFANKLLFEALTLEKNTSNNSQELAILYHNIAGNYRNLGDYDNSILMTEQARIHQAKKKNIFGIAREYYTEGLSQMEKGILDQSIMSFDKSIEMLQTNDEKTSALRIELHQAKAEAKIKLGLLRQALTELSKAAQLQIDYPHRIYKSLELEAQAAKKSGNVDQARANFEKALTLAQTELAGSKEYNTSERLYGEIGDLLLYEQDNFQKALVYYNSGIKSYTGLTASDLTSATFVDNISLSDEVLHLLIGRYKAEQIPNKKVLAVDAAINYLDRLKSSYLTEGSKFFIAEQASDIYADAVEIYLSGDSEPSAAVLDKVYSVMEKNKAGVLLEQLQHKFNLLSSSLPDDLVQKEVQLQTSISYQSKLMSEAMAAEDDDKIEQIRSQLFKVKEELTLFKANVAESYPEYDNFKNSLDSEKKIQDLQPKLTSEQVLLEYMASRDYLYTLVVTDSKASVAKIERSKIDSLIKTYLDAISSPPTESADPRELARVSAELRSLLLPSDMSDYGHAIIIPDGILSRIPLESLVLEDGSYLVEHMSIQYAYSADQLHGADKSELQQANVLCIAPIFATPNTKNRSAGNTELQALPYAEEEAKYIAQKCNATLVASSTTSPADLTARIHEYNVIHLGTHASVSDVDPMLSEVHFNEGSLTNYDIRDLNISPDLVVLNACNTANGKLQVGEGMIGLSRGFFQAGVRCLQSNLWSVNDQSSSQIVTAMYDNMLEGMPISKSLQQAKLSYLNTADKRRAHPYYWAGMVQIGQDSSPLQSSSIAMWWYLIAALAAVLFIIFVIKKRA